MVGAEEQAFFREDGREGIWLERLSRKVESNLDFMSMTGKYVRGNNAMGWSLVVAANSNAVLNQNLLKSACIDGRCQVIAKWGFASAGAAYNAGLDEARHEIVVFAHQDIYLPYDWATKLEVALKHLAEIDPDWGVLGVYGVAQSGQPAGHVHTTGLGQTLGAPFEGVVEAQTLDEVVLILRASSGLRFDERLPGFHLYGTDICTEAGRRGMKDYIFAGFCIHNSNGIPALPWAFWKGYLYLRRKWWDRLPIATSCTTITRSAWSVVRGMLWDLPRSLLRPQRVGRRCEHVEALYRELLRRGDLSEG